MKVTEKDLRIEGIRDSQVDGVKIAEGTVPIEDSDYFSDADEYLFSTRSRLARNFKEAGIIPRGAEYDPLGNAMRNRLDGPALKIEDDRAIADLYVRDQYVANGFNPVNSFDIEKGDRVGRLAAYNREEVGVVPETYSTDFPAERQKAEDIIGSANDGRSIYEDIIHPAIQPDISDLDSNEGVNAARDVVMVELDDSLLEPVNMSKEEIMNKNLAKLVKSGDDRPEKVGPGNYLTAIKEPVTEEGFYTVLKNPMTAGQHVNSRLADPEWQDRIVVEFSYPRIIGEVEDESEAFNFPSTLPTNYIMKT
jgi:hypothetical protein